jgi:hypothetical protein
VFSLHALSFALANIMMNPILITWDGAIQEVLNFDVITFQVTEADVHTTAPTLFCQLPLHQSCTNTVVPKDVVYY